MKILIPFDGSDSAQKAVDYALSLAQKDPEVKVTLLAVACTDYVYFSKNLIDNPIAIMEACRNFLKSHLEKAKEKFAEKGIEVDTVIESGDAAEIIVNMVNSEGFDHVIMGRRGLSVLRGFLLGSVSAKVLANVKVPVTLLR
ncbi:universal stress protein [Desulfotomaculum varum]